MIALAVVSFAAGILCKTLLFDREWRLFMVEMRKSSAERDTALRGLHRDVTGEEMPDDSV